MQKKRVKHKVFNRCENGSRSVNALTYHSKRYSRPVTNQPGSPVCNRKSCFDESHLHNRCTPSQQPPVSYTPPEPEPMMTENMHLSFAERQRRNSPRCYVFYCGGRRACDHNMPQSTTASMGECYSTSSLEHATSYYTDNADCIQCFNSIHCPP